MPTDKSAYRGALASLDSLRLEFPRHRFIPWSWIKHRIPAGAKFTRCPLFLAGLTARGLKPVKAGKTYGCGPADWADRNPKATN